MKNIREGDLVSYQKNKGEVIKFIPALNGKRFTEGKGAHSYTREINNYERFDRALIRFGEYRTSKYGVACVIVNCSKIEKDL